MTMIEAIILQVFSMLCLTSLAIVSVVTIFRDNVLDAKERTLKRLIEAGYETDKLDIETYFNNNKQKNK